LYDLSFVHNISDNDEDALACGRSDVLEKLTCAGSVVVEDIMDMVDCLVPQKAGCMAEIGKNIKDCITGDCNLEIGHKCLSEQRELTIPKTAITMDHGDGTHYINTEFRGMFDVFSGVVLKLNPSETSFEATVTLRFRVDTFIVNILTLHHQTEDKGKDSWQEYETEIIPKVPMIKDFTIMAGPVPITVSIDLQPMLWLGMKTQAISELEFQIDGVYEFEQSFIVDIDDNRYEGDFEPSDDNGVTFKINKLSLQGNMELDARLGFRLSIEINTIPIQIDVAPRLGGILNGRLDYKGFELEAPLEGDLCWFLKAIWRLTLDARIGVSFDFENPLSLMEANCGLVAVAIAESLNIPNQMIDRAQCFSDYLGISTDKIDDMQDDIEEKVAEFTSTFCYGVVNKVAGNMPNSCGRTAQLQTQWLTFTEFAIPTSGKNPFDFLETEFLATCKDDSDTIFAKNTATSQALKQSTCDKSRAIGRDPDKRIDDLIKDEL